MSACLDGNFTRSRTADGTCVGSITDFSQHLYTLLYDLERMFTRS